MCSRFLKRESRSPLGIDHGLAVSKEEMVKSQATWIRVGATAGERQGHRINRSERLGAAVAVAVRKEFLCGSQTTGFLGVTRSQQ